MTSEGPFQPAKLKGRAAEGLAFQRKVQKLMGSLASQGEVYKDQWVRYKDSDGWHWCQLDGLFVGATRAVVVESKLSLRRLPTGVSQLAKLYHPIISWIFSKPTLTCLAFHHWVPDVGEDLELIDSARELATYPIGRASQPVGWHVL